jgi:hypothetical protein
MTFIDPSRIPRPYIDPAQLLIPDPAGYGYINNPVDELIYQMGATMPSGTGGLGGTLGPAGGLRPGGFASLYDDLAAMNADDLATGLARQAGYLEGAPYNPTGAGVGGFGTRAYASGVSGIPGVPAAAGMADDVVAGLAAQAVGQGTASKIPGFARALFPYAPKVAAIEGLTPAAARAAAGAGRLAGFARGAWGPAVIGTGLSLLGDQIARGAADTKGIDRSDVGGFLSGFGQAGALTGTLALAAGAGPVGWTAAGLAAAGYGLYKALGAGGDGDGKGKVDLPGARDQIALLIGQAPEHLRDYFNFKVTTQMQMAGDDEDLQRQTLATIGDEILSQMLTAAQTQYRTDYATDLSAQIADRYADFQTLRNAQYEQQQAVSNDYLKQMAGRLDPAYQDLFLASIGQTNQAQAAAHRAYMAQYDALPYQLALQLTQTSPQIAEQATAAGYRALPTADYTRLAELLTGTGAAPPAGAVTYAPGFGP